MNNGVGRYKQIDIATAPQNKLIIMLYEAAVSSLEKAASAMDKKHGVEEAHNSIMKAQDIIYELLASLNYDAGEIANRLASIYTYMNKRLTEANISKNKEPVVEVLGYLKELLGAWETIMDKTPEKTSGASAKKDGNGKLNVVG